MAKEYEMALVLRPELDEEHQNAVLDRYRHVIETHGGEAEEPNVWGKRRLAYDIKDQSEGIYIFVPFKADSTANAELDRLLRIDENVLRHLVVVRPRPNPPKPVSMPESTPGGRTEGMRSGPVPASDRPGPGLPVRRSDILAAQARAAEAAAPDEPAEAPEASAEQAPSEEKPAEE